MTACSTHPSIADERAEFTNRLPLPTEDHLNRNGYGVWNAGHPLTSACVGDRNGSISPAGTGWSGTPGSRDTRCSLSKLSTRREPEMTDRPTPGATATLHLHGGLARTYTVAWVTPCGSRVALDDGTNRNRAHLFAQPGWDADSNSGWFWNGFRVTFDNGALT